MLAQVHAQCWRQLCFHCCDHVPRVTGFALAVRSRQKFSTVPIFDAALVSDVARFGAMQPRPVTLAEILDCLKPWSVAKFIQREYPIRCAQRIIMLESIPAWDEIPEFVEVHSRHVWAFDAMRRVERHPTLDSFTSLVNEIANGNREHVHLMALGCHKLAKERGDEFSSDFIDKFLDNFLSNRIGTNGLLLQYAALTGKFEANHMRTGIVDPQCDVTAICRDAAQAVQQICVDGIGRKPVIRVRAHTAAGSDDGAPRMPYIPMLLKYMLQEILKNSSRATLEFVDKDADLESWPIMVEVCADEQRVLICVADKAGGIPFAIGQRIWSYLYTTADKATALAGFGVGLPIARLYARYLGGSLNLVSLPGLGTHAYIFLPRLLTDQVEVVPTSNDFSHRDSDGNFLV